MSVNVVEGMFKTLDKAITEQVAGNFQAIYEIIFPIWSVGVCIYYVIVAWEIIYSDKQIIANEFVKHLMIIAVVTVFMGATSVYVSDVVPFVMNSGQEIAGKLAGDAGSTGVLIDKMIDTIIEMGERQTQIFEDAGFWDKVGAGMMYIVKLCVLAFFAGAFIVYATAYLIIAMVMVGILLSLGGIFIAFAAFPATRQMFTAWVGSCFNYIFLNISYAILFTLLIKYLDAFLTQNSLENDPDNFWFIMLIALVFSIGVFLLQQVAALMSILTGGVGINGLTGAVNNFMGKAAGALGLKAAGNLMGRGLAAGAKAAGAKGAKAAGAAAAHLWRTATGKGRVRGG